MNLREENQTGVKDEPAKDTSFVALTIMHADGSAIKLPFLADRALSVHQLLHQPLLAGALSVDGDTKFALRVVSSSPRRCRLLVNMEETLGDVLAHEQSSIWSPTVGNLAASQIGAQVVRDASRRGILGRAVRSRGRCVRVGWGCVPGSRGNWVGCVHLQSSILFLIILPPSQLW